MLKKLKSFLTTLSIGTAMVMPMAMPAMVHAQVGEDDIANGAACGAELSFDGNCTASDPGSVTKVNSILKLAINMFSVVVGFISVIMIIVGGLKYITSGGDSGNITGAKNTILYAIIGLVVVALAQIVVKFVLTKTVGSA